MFLHSLLYNYVYSFLILPDFPLQIPFSFQKVVQKIVFSSCTGYVFQSIAKAETEFPIFNDVNRLIVPPLRIMVWVVNNFSHDKRGLEVVDLFNFKSLEAVFAFAILEGEVLLLFDSVEHIGQKMCICAV